MAKCNPTPEAKRIIRAMAKAQLEAGVTEADDVLDAIHAAIADFAPMDKSEIADIVSGFGQVRKETKSELQERLTQLRRDLKKLAHPDAKDAAKNAARQKAIHKQIAEINRKIETKDFSKAPPKPKPVYTEETQKLQAELDHARRRADMELRQLEWKSRSRVQRALTFGAALHRAMILATLSVYEHLAGASLQRLVSTIFEDAAGAGLRHIPGLREIDDMAMLEGGGFMGRGQLEGFIGNAEGTGGRGMFSKETAKAMKDKMLKGASDRQVMMKGAHESNFPLLDMVGHSHDAIKTPLEQHAYARAYYRATQNSRRMLARSGKSADEIDKIMATDSMQATLNGISFEASQAAKLQGKNALTEAYQRGLRRLENWNDVGAFMANLLRLEAPIVKIPANMVSETLSLAAGGLKARVRYTAATRNGGKLTAEDADYIMRNLKKQTVGAGALALGYLYHEAFGGQWRKNREKPNKDLEIGDIDTPVGTVSHHWLHGPLAQTMQMGAMIHYVQDEDYAKAVKEGGESSDWANAADGAAQATMAMLLDIPGMDIPGDIEKLGSGQKGVRRWAGEKARQTVIPAFLQQLAKSQDEGPDGKPTKRYPKTFVEELKMGIPGLRKDVSAQDPSKKPKKRSPFDDL